LSNHTQKITLAGGCFWCIESAFNNVQGITSAVSGYMGGQTNNPSYQDITTGKTGHAEVVQLTFDDTVITTKEIFEIFFSLHNPTQLNYQGHDVGTQYRSAIFFHHPRQQTEALKIITQINQDEIWPDPVVTSVELQTKFYTGENYHQEYFNKNPGNPYCQVIISPKLAKFKQTFASKLK